MSTIIAVKRPAAYYLFCDRHTHYDGCHIYREDPKIIIKEIVTPSAVLDRLYVGFTGQVKLQNVFITDVVPDVIFDKNAYDKKYVIRFFEKKVKEAVEANGLFEDKKMGGTLLGMCSLGVFLVSSDITTMFLDAPFWAIGSGGKFALGALSMVESLLQDERFEEEDFLALIKRVFAGVSKLDVYTSETFVYFKHEIFSPNF